MKILTGVELYFTEPFHHAVLTAGHEEIFRAVRQLDTQYILLLRVIRSNLADSVMQDKRR